MQSHYQRRSTKGVTDKFTPPGFRTPNEKFSNLKSVNTLHQHLNKMLGKLAILPNQ
jgi:hypothetical protein